MNRSTKLLALALCFSFLYASVWAADTTASIAGDRQIVGLIPGPEFPAIEPPPACPGPTCPVVPPTDDEFKWISEKPGEIKVFSSVSSELISDTDMNICWTYPADFKPMIPGGATVFEAVFLEDSKGSKTFKQVYEVTGNKAADLGSGCLRAPTKAPDSPLEVMHKDPRKGTIKPGYTMITPADLERRTLMIAGYYSDSTFVPGNLKSSGEIVYFAVGTDGKGYSGKISVAVVENAAGKESEVWVNTQTPLGIAVQKSARTAAKIAQEMNPALPKYSYFFKIADNQIGSVDGPSAGAAMTVLASKVLKKEAIKQKVGITGTIEYNGAIGKVGGVNVKASAANALGAPAAKFSFLVPTGQKSEITTAYPNIESKEVANIQDALKEFETSDAYADVGFSLGTVGTEMNGLIWGIAPKIVDKKALLAPLKFVTVNTGAAFEKKQEIKGNQFNFDSTGPNVSQPFELELVGIDKTKPLVLGVGDGLSCDQIALWVNSKAVKLDQSWLDKALASTKSAALTSFNWLKSVVGVQNTPQGAAGLQKINNGEWLTGGAQITGAEAGRLLVGTLKTVWVGVKAVGVTIYEGGKAMFYEIKDDIYGTTTPVTVTPTAPAAGTTGGIDVTNLVQNPAAAGNMYLQVDAESGRLYIVGNQDWTDRPGLQSKLLLQKIDNQSVSTLSGGKSVKFIACQFESKDTVVQVGRKADVTFTFGKVFCTTISECLGIVDTKFMQIFAGQ